MTPSDPEAVSPSRRRAPLLIGGAVAVVAAVVATLLLAKGTDDTDNAAGDQRTNATSTQAAADEPGASATAGTYDLSTPEAAASSFATAASTGSGEALLELACVGRLACVTEHIPGVTEEQLTAARSQISEGVFELSEHLKGAEFGTAVDGPQPGTKDVPYRTPTTASDGALALTFIQFEGDWLYYNPTT